MKMIIMALLTIFSCKMSFGADCTNEDKAILSWKKGCKARLVVDKIGSGTEYKGDPCTCALDLFSDITKLTDDQECVINANTVIEVFRTDKFKAKCGEKK